MKIKSLFLTLIFTIIVATAFTQTNEEKHKTADDMINNYQFSEAAPILIELTNSEPENFTYTRDLAFTYLNLYDYRKAIELFEKAIELNPDCIKCYSHLSRAWYETNNLEEAEKIITEGFKLSDTTAHLYMTRGLIYQAYENMDKAMLDFTKAVQLDRTNTDFLITRANFYIQTNQNHFAYSDISDAIKLDPENAEYYYYRAYILLHLQLYDEALIDINTSITLNNSVADFYNLQFSIYFSIKDYELAEKSLMNSLKIQPDSYMAYINLADLYFQSSKIEEYCTANHKALELIPPENEYQIKSIQTTTDKYCNDNRMPYYFVRSLTSYNNGNLNETIEIISAGLKKIDKSSVLENLLATCYMSLKDYDKAFEYFNKSYDKKDMLEDEVVDFYSIELKKEDIEYVANSYIIKSDFGLGMIYLINHKTEEALVRLKQAEKMAESLEDFEGKEFVNNVIGYVLLYNNEYDKAFEQYDIAIKKNPYYQLSYLNKAVTKLLQACKYKRSKLQFEFDDYFNSLRLIIPKLKLKNGQDELLKESLNICNTVIENDPNCAYAYLIKAKISEFLGDADYKKYADKAIELNIPNAYDELNIK